MPQYRRRPQGHRGPDPFILALAGKLLHEISQLEHKPPVTLAFMAAQAAIFMLPTLPMQALPMELKDLVRWIPSIQRGCLRPSSVIEGGQWWRLVWSAFLHADEWHLYYNMSSFLWKGLQLEPAYGPARFLALILELLLSCQSLYCGLFWAARALYGPQSPAILEMYSYTCAVGFSGVLFGLKAVLMSGTSSWQHYAAWAELVIIQMVMPNVSFVGHLCGILAGLLHVYVTRRLIPAMRPADIAPQAPRGPQAEPRRQRGWWGGRRRGGWGMFGEPRFRGHGTPGGGPAGGHYGARY